MLLANYASDSDSDNGSGPSAKPAVTTGPAKSTAATTTVKGKKRTGPIKITLDLPKSAPGSQRDAREDDDDRAGDEAGGFSDDEEGRASKKAKFSGGLKGGKGASSLLGMLPPPKRKLPAAIPSGASLSVNKSMAATPKPNLPAPTARELAGGNGADEDEEDDDVPAASSSSVMLPPSMARKSKKKEEPPMDLFGLASASSSGPSASASSSTATAVLPPQITSAPAVADFQPPPPTADDPYPGYYQLPSGQWAAYEPEYYHSFFASSGQGKTYGETTEEEDDGGRIGKHWADYDQSVELVDVQASEGLSEARQAEMRRQLAKPKKNEDEFDYKPIGQVKGLASERHQLSSLLNVAFTQREQLEDRIATNKKSARMAKTKYGF